MDYQAFENYVFDYVKNSRSHLLNPRTLENPNFSDQFGDWYDAVLNEDHPDDYPILIFPEDFLRARNLVNNMPVITKNIFSSHVYPQHAICEYGHFIIWDSHFWDLYSFWLVTILNLTIVKGIYIDGTKTAEEAKNDYTKTQRNLMSIMLLFLTSRFEKSPLLSYVIAEKYYNDYRFIPQYNQPYSLSAEKTMTVEDYLKGSKLNMFLDYAKQFVYSHEVTHIKLRTQTVERQIAFEQVKNFCKVTIDVKDIVKELGISTPNDEIVCNFAHLVLNEKSDDLIEEIFCDYNAMLISCKKIINETGNEDSAALFILAVKYVSLFLQWLDNSEMMWLFCADVFNVQSEENKSIKLRKQIEMDKKYNKMVKDMERINARNIFATTMLCNKLNLNPTSDECGFSSQFETLSSNWFNNNILPMFYATYEGPFIMKTLEKMKDIKKSNISIAEMKRKRNFFIGWEEWLSSTPQSRDSSIYNQSQKLNCGDDTKMSNNATSYNDMKSKQKKEALNRIDELTEKFSLNPNIKEYFKKGKLYYSYLTAGGLIGSIDRIDYDERYPKAVSNFEKDGRLVFHCIEFNNTLACLFVGKSENEWESEKTHGGKIRAYIYDFSHPEQSKIDYITIGSYGSSGALIRFR